MSIITQRPFQFIGKKFPRINTKQVFNMCSSPSITPCNVICTIPNKKNNTQTLSLINEGKKNTPYNILLIGGHGCGKSTYVDKIITGYFRQKYIKDDLSIQTKISFNTNHGQRSTIITQCANIVNNKSVIQPEYDGIMVMHEYWKSLDVNLLEKLSHKPIIHLLSKYDLLVNKKKQIILTIDSVGGKKSHICVISSKYGINLYAPFSYLLTHIENAWETPLRVKSIMTK